jgi:hypothetical protein
MTSRDAGQRAQCTAILESHGRRWRCTRPAAKKHGNKFCGRCAPKPPRCGATAADRFRYHRSDCVGCGFDCCTDPALHVAGRCFETGTLRPISRKPGEIAERIGREIIRRWLATAPVELYHHQGHHHFWHQLTKLGSWKDGEFVPHAKASNSDSERPDGVVQQ